jgi:hypothetical protein
MRTYTSGLVPIFTLLAAALVARPELASGQELAATSSLVAAVELTPASTLEFESALEWKAYATRLQSEAAILPAGSAESLEKIRTAASIRFSNGEKTVALELIVNAAEAAARSGSVALAANAYLDGAWIATSMNRPNQVNELAERAVMLTISPLMGEVDRLAVLRRVESTIQTELAAR